MKIATSYFYQIRNFKRNMIPISTCITDPSWYHNFSNNNSHIFYDKRKILNGIRCETIIEQGKYSNHGSEICPCKQKEYSSCSFLEQYRKNLENINFNILYNDFLKLAKSYKEKENIEEEIILVLIVYEVPNNPCSERLPLQEYFKNHGVECQELEYPIQNFNDIKREEFIF